MNPYELQHFDIIQSPNYRLPYVPIVSYNLIDAFNRSIVPPDPTRDIKETLVSAVESYSKKQIPYRIILEYHEKYSITIDIFSVKRCPDESLDESWRLELSKQNSRFILSGIPLLFCRYSVIDKSKVPIEEAFANVTNWVHAYKADIEEKDEKGLNILKLLKSKETMNSIVELLKQNHRLLDSNCLSQWREESEYNRDGRFIPSFLIPLPIPTTPAITSTSDPFYKPQLRCSLPTCDNAGILKCSRCQLAYYCCRDHQRDCWPIHKRLCKVYIHV